MKRPINFISSSDSTEIKGKVAIDAESAKKYFIKNAIFKFTPIPSNLKVKIKKSVCDISFENNLVQEMFDLIKGDSFYIFEYCIEGSEKGKQLNEKIDLILKFINTNRIKSMLIYLERTQEHSFSFEEAKALRAVLPFKREDSPIILSSQAQKPTNKDMVYAFVMVMASGGIF